LWNSLLFLAHKVCGNFRYGGITFSNYGKPHQSSCSSHYKNSHPRPPSVFGSIRAQIQPYYVQSLRGNHTRVILTTLLLELPPSFYNVSISVYVSVLAISKTYIELFSTLSNLTCKVFNAENVSKILSVSRKSILTKFVRFKISRSVPVMSRSITTALAPNAKALFRHYQNSL
jgi:hypothetical protein